MAVHLEMSKAAYKLRVAIGETRMIVSSLMELGLIYQAGDESKDALTYFLKADSASANINDPVTRSELSIGLAEILLEDHFGNLQPAQKLLLTKVMDNAYHLCNLIATLAGPNDFKIARTTANEIAAVPGMVGT